jgi:ankyrin repeat protein
MPFSDLPRDILLEMASQLDDAGMNALCRTNRQIYNFLNGYLYRRDIGLSGRGCKSLPWALCEGNKAEATVQHAIAANLDPIPERVYERYHFALRDAAAEGHTRLVKQLLKVEGINPNFGHNGHSPLVFAAKGGRAATTKFLLATPGVDPNIMIQNPSYPRIDWDRDYTSEFLGYHGLRSHLETITNLLMDDIVDCDRDRTSLLMLSVTKPNIVKLLLDRKDIDVNKQDSKGCTALMCAAQCPLSNFGLETAKLLLDRDDIDVNLPDRDGRTALFRASCPSMIDLLLKKEGIGVKARNFDGYSLICYLHFTQTPNDVAMARLLLSHPDTDPNPVDNNGVSLLSHVILNVTPVFGWQLELLLRAAGATQRCIQYCQTSSLRA